MSTRSSRKKVNGIGRDAGAPRKHHGVMGCNCRELGRLRTSISMKVWERRIPRRQALPTRQCLSDGIRCLLAREEIFWR